ncbi:MAG: ankyrin repeat domain-containing protein [Gammaproteobacteria bacterium]
MSIGRDLSIDESLYDKRLLESAARVLSIQSIDEAALANLFLALEENPHIKKLEIENINGEISDATLQALQKMLERNSKLTSINLGNAVIPELMEEKLADSLNANFNLREIKIKLRSDELPPYIETRNKQLAQGTAFLLQEELLSQITNADIKMIFNINMGNLIDKALAGDPSVTYQMLLDALQKTLDGLNDLTENAEPDLLAAITNTTDKIKDFQEIIAELATAAKAKNENLLHIVSAYGLISHMDKLIVLGFPPDKKNLEGQSAVDYASAGSQRDALVYLNALPTMPKEKLTSDAEPVSLEDINKRKLNGLLRTKRPEHLDRDIQQYEGYKTLFKQFLKNFPAVKQSDLESKLSLFLTSLGDENLSKYAGGLCNAFAFMNFRADLIGQEYQNLRRIEDLMKLKTDSIEEMAKSYKEYKAERLAQIEILEGEGDLPALNRELNMLHTKLSTLRKEKPEKKDEIQTLENQIRALRKSRDNLIEDILIEKLGTETVKTARDAEELYIYIHNLVGAFNPGEDLDFRIDEEYVAQKDFLKTLQLFPADKLSSQDSAPAKQVLEIAFLFKREELIALLDNALQQNTFCDGDYIRLASSNHATYLTKKNGQILLYNPTPIEIIPNTAEGLVTTIEEKFFKNKNTDFMPIALCIFEKTGIEKEKITRPSQQDLIQKILDKRPDKSLDAKTWDEMTAISMAAKYGHCDTVTKLIEEKATTIDTQDNDGWTPALYAASRNYVLVLDVLGKAGADLNQHNKAGFTAAYMAAENGFPEIIKVLHQHKADLDKPNFEGHTPAIKAASSNQANILKTLYDCKADLNKADAKGLTPLHFAMQESHLASIKILIDCGVALDLKDKEGKTAMDYASENVKAFLSLQQLKQYIETRNWKEKCPTIAANQLRRINAAEINNDWSAALKEIIEMAKPPRDRVGFFAPKDEDTLNHLKLFSTPEESMGAITKILNEEKAAASSREKEIKDDLTVKTGPDDALSTAAKHIVQAKREKQPQMTSDPKAKQDQPKTDTLQEHPTITIKHG